MKPVNTFFVSYVEVPSMRVGKKQTVETLINEDALLFAKYLRNELKTWNLESSKPNLKTYFALFQTYEISRFDNCSEQEN